MTQPFAAGDDGFIYQDQYAGFPVGPVAVESGRKAPPAAASPWTSGNVYGHYDQNPVSGDHNTLFNDGALDAVVYKTDGSLQIVIDKAKLGVRAGDTLLSAFADSQPSDTG